MTASTREHVSWYDSAACRGTELRLWYASDHDVQLEALALAICATCPVIGACLASTMAEEPRAGRVWGTRAGMTQRQRRDALSGHGPRCGTESGYRAHVRAKTSACQPCLAASRQAARDRARWRAILAAPITEMGNAPRVRVDPELENVAVSRCPTCGGWVCDAASRRVAHTCDHEEVEA